MARRCKGRAVDGIVLLDKPLDVSSNDALQRVKRIYSAAKAGHTGALDPLATGMLPVCLGEATKFSQFLLDSDKTYEVTAKLGMRTTTSDAAGEVIARQQVRFGEQELLAAVEKFKGPGKQVPSMFSALKHQGKPLYHYARQGIDIPREARDIHIFRLDVDRFVGDEVDMTVHCSKGTYIRTLVDDLGQMLGCGAYVSKLHRIQVADYPRKNMVTLDTLEHLVTKAQKEKVEPASYLDRLLLPMDTAVQGLQALQLDNVSCHYFRHGNPIPMTKKDDMKLDIGSQVRVYDQTGSIFLGIGQITQDGKVAPKRLVVREEKATGTDN